MARANFGRFEEGSSGASLRRFGAEGVLQRGYRRVSGSIIRATPQRHLSTFVRRRGDLGRRYLFTTRGADCRHRHRARSEQATSGLQIGRRWPGTASIVRVPTKGATWGAVSYLPTCGRRLTSRHLARFRTATEHAGRRSLGGNTNYPRTTSIVRNPDEGATWGRGHPSAPAGQSLGVEGIAMSLRTATSGFWVQITPNQRHLSFVRRRWRLGGALDLSACRQAFTGGLWASQIAPNGDVWLAGTPNDLSFDRRRATWG